MFSFGIASLSGPVASITEGLHEHGHTRISTLIRFVSTPQAARKTLMQHTFSVNDPAGPTDAFRIAIIERQVNVAEMTFALL